MFIKANHFPKKEQALAKKLQLSMRPKLDLNKTDPYFQYSEAGLAYHTIAGTLTIDWLCPSFQRRLLSHNLKKELLLKACRLQYHSQHAMPKEYQLATQDSRNQTTACMRTRKLRKDKSRPVKGKGHILDATAGLGQDSLLLAAAGVSVTALEKSPIVHALLIDAQQRLDDHLSVYKQQLSLQFVCQDTKAYLLQQASQHFQIIYLDPMHPARRSAKISQPMRVLRTIATHPDHMEDLCALFDIAQKYATERVIVKWPLKMPSPLPVAHFNYSGKRMRFDVYLSSQ